jgi:glyoxylase-like metal-dependent hydrolase (beta-lactamase superfamily II)
MIGKRFHIGSGMADRRHFLRTLLGGAAGLSLAGVAPLRALARSADPLAVTRLSEKLALISGAGGNVVALSGPDGVLLVDCGVAERTRELLATVASLPGGRHIPTVFNTHWHWDHTGGNELLRKAGASILAHENTRLWLGAEIHEEWENRVYKPRPPAALPTQTFYKTGRMTFGNEPIEYGYLPQAHTDGDIYVYFRGENVLVAGDVVSVGRYPILDYSTGGWIGGMADATQKLLDLTDDKTRIVPGTGPVQSRADVASEHEMLATLKEDLWQLMRKGYGAEDMIEARATSKYDTKWGDPRLFIAAAYRGFYGHLRGDLRGVV